MPSRSPRTFAVPALCAWVAACGAQTGLPVPHVLTDAGREDAGVDAGRDVGVDATVPCLELPLMGGPLDAALRLEAEVGRADVVFLVDVTSSMVDEISQIRSRLRDRIAPAIRAAIPDSQLAVTTHGDFPVAPYGVSPFDRPFEMVVPSTNDLARVQAGMDALQLGSGGDIPESQIEALYQIATGEGLSTFIAASGGCPGGGIGYPCIRRDALPVVLLFTDAPMHNGPSGDAYQVSRLGVRPHTFDATMAAYQAISGRIIGFDSGDGQGAPDLRAVATRTGTLDGRGNPLVFDIGARGERLTEEVVGAIRTFASTVVQDVDAVVRDPDPTDGVDARALVEYVEPVSASPMSGIERIDVPSHTFVGVDVGTVLTFRLVIRRGVAIPGPEPRFVEVEVVFRGNGRTRLGSQTITVLVPAADGRGCASL